MLVGSGRAGLDWVGRGGAGLGRAGPTGGSIAGQRFGESVSISGSQLLIGAPGYQDNLDYGIAYLYNAAEVSGIHRQWQDIHASLGWRLVIVIE